jgi:hypothetical protein
MEEHSDMPKRTNRPPDFLSEEPHCSESKEASEAWTILDFKPGAIVHSAIPPALKNG